MASKSAVARREQALTRLSSERQWMEEHGGNLSAYLARYGSKNDPEHYGDGGEAIFAADKAALDKAEAEALAAIRVARAS